MALSSVSASGGSAGGSRPEPLILIIPGLHDSGPDHWQSHWLRRRPDARRVELGMWDNPHRNTWVNKLNLAIHRASRPVFLVAHSLGCLTVAWWAEYERPGPGSGIMGALLVAPPDVDRAGIDPRLTRFAARPRRRLPFPTALVASRNDPFCAPAEARGMARDWGSRFIDAGDAGHINVASGYGEWRGGERLLDAMLGAMLGAIIGPQPGAANALPWGPVPPGARAAGSHVR